MKIYSSDSIRLGILKLLNARELAEHSKAEWAALWHEGRRKGSISRSIELAVASILAHRPGRALTHLLSSLDLVQQLQPDGTVTSAGRVELFNAISEQLDYDSDYALNSLLEQISCESISASGFVQEFLSARNQADWTMPVVQIFCHPSTEQQTPFRIPEQSDLKFVSPTFAAQFCEGWHITDGLNIWQSPTGIVPGQPTVIVTPPERPAEAWNFKSMEVRTA